MPEGCSIDFSGQYKVMVRTALELLSAIGAAVVLFYPIIVMQFGSWLQPLVILPTVLGAAPPRRQNFISWGVRT